MLIFLYLVVHNHTQFYFIFYMNVVVGYIVPKTLTRAAHTPPATWLAVGNDTFNNKSNQTAIGPTVASIMSTSFLADFCRRHVSPFLASASGSL